MAEAQSKAKTPLKFGSWADDMETMRLGMAALFTNDFAEAERIFQAGMEEAAGVDGDHDVRGAFGLQNALAAVIRGVASLTNDQLDECITRVWEADALAQAGDKWIGQTVVRGVSILVGGMVQILQQRFVKGVVNILRSWSYIKTLQTPAALEYQGKEREVIRSAALYSVGVANLVISMLPNAMMQAASYVSGFKGSREEALDMLLTCWKEGGMLSTWAAISWLGYYVDAKTFLGLRQTNAELEQCEEIFAWANERYPDSIFFFAMEADLAACRQDLPRAMRISQRALPLIGDLKALEWLCFYKRGAFCLSEMRWLEAAEDFKRSLQIYIKVERRSMVPFMAAYAALSYMVGGEQDKAVEMLNLIKKYKKMKKKNWGRQDMWAFRLRKKYKKHGNGGESGVASEPASEAPSEADDDTLPEGIGNEEGEEDEFEDKSPEWPLLDLFESMVFRIRSTVWMTHEMGEKLRQLLVQQGEQNPRIWGGPDEQARVHMCLAGSMLQQQREGKDGNLVLNDDIVEVCRKGLALKPKMSKSGKRNGAIQMLLYLQGMARADRGDWHGARKCLTDLERKKGPYAFKVMTQFKATALRKRIKEAVASSYHSLQAVRGTAHKVTVRIDRDLLDALDGAEIEWDWNIKAHSISFTATFVPDEVDDDLPTELQAVTRHEPGLKGAFLPEHPGLLTLTFDNTFSYFKGKSIKYRLSPAAVHAIAEEQSA